MYDLLVVNYYVAKLRKIPQYSLVKNRVLWFYFFDFKNVIEHNHCIAAYLL